MRRLGSSGIWSGSIMNHGRWSWNTECHWISPVASPPSRPSKHGPLHQWTQCSPHHDSTAGVMKFSHKFHCFLLKFYHPLSPPTGQTNSSFPVDPDSPTNQPTNPRGDTSHPPLSFSVATKSLRVVSRSSVALAFSALADSMSAAWVAISSVRPGALKKANPPVVFFPH